MRIYFGGSVRGLDPDLADYQQIMETLGGYGEVLTEYIALGEESTGADDRSIFKRQMAWLEASDVMVAEVSSPSLGVGYEIAKAEALQKPTLCLFRRREHRLSAMIAGNAQLRVCHYEDIEEAISAIDAFLA